MTRRRWTVTPDAPGGISWENGPGDPGGSDVQELFIWNDPRDPDTVDAVKALAQCVATLAEARQLAGQIALGRTPQGRRVIDHMALDALLDLLTTTEGVGE